MARATAKTELFAAWKQGSLVVADEGLSTGARWWVHSGTGTNSTGFGKSPDAPFASLDYASTQCTAGAGDLIYVMSGHTETIINATGCNLAVAGVKVVGLGAGVNRPTFTFTTANAATMTVDAANVTIENLLLVCGKDGQTAMLDVNATDCTVKNCEFRNDAATQAVTLIDVTTGANGADRLKVEGCRLISLTIGATQGIELGKVNDGVQIIGNYIWGDWSAAGIHNIVAEALTNLLIKGNVVANLNSGDHAIELVSACTGMCIDNRMYGDTLGTILDPGSLYCAGNLEVDAIDQAAVDSPRTSAGGFPDASITAAAIAAGAFDSSKFVDGWLDSTAFAANAFQSTTFQDNALDSTVFSNDAAMALTRGVHVLKATGALPANGTSTIFTIAGGRVLLTGILGQATATVQTLANNSKLTSTPTVGSAVDICANVDITAMQTGAHLSITGTLGDAMVKTNAGAAKLQVAPVVLMTGALGWTTDTTATGSIKWDAWYVPLDQGATLA